jgi:hypothetical protein
MAVCEGEINSIRLLYMTETENEGLKAGFHNDVMRGT